jgi:hypothetical protein
MECAVGGTVDGRHSGYCFGLGDGRAALRTHSCACVGFVDNHPFGSHFRTWMQAGQSVPVTRGAGWLPARDDFFVSKACKVLSRTGKAGTIAEPKRSSRREDHYFGT